jgi:Na+/H+ antiporter NhaA
MPIQYVARAGERIAGALGEFLRLESAGGILLMIATAVALVFANTGAVGLYQAFLGTPVEIRVGAFMLGKPLILWINDGLMAVFFFLVGLEIKREVMEGELSNPSQLALPALAAVGGMAAPAAIFWLLNRHDPVALQGWAAVSRSRSRYSCSPWRSSTTSARSSSSRSSIPRISPCPRLPWQAARS